MYWCTFLSLPPPFADTEVVPTTTTGSTSVGLAQVPSNGSHGALGLPGATGRQLLWPWRSWIASYSNLKLENMPALQLIYFHNFALKIPQGCRCHFLVQTVWSDLIGYSASCCHPVPGNLGLLGQGYHDAAQEIGPKHCFPRLFAKVIKMICEQKKCILLRGALEKGQEQLKFDGISYVFQFNFNSHISHVNFEAPWYLDVCCQAEPQRHPWRCHRVCWRSCRRLRCRRRERSMPQASSGIPFHPQMKGIPS